MAEAVVLPGHRWTRAAYERIAATGVLEDARVELLEGVVVDMTPPSPEHGDVLRQLIALFASAAAERRLEVQMPFAATDDSMPEPDLAVSARPGGRGYLADALLVVEVVVTQGREARVKERVYARAGVPVYWIVDVSHRAVEVLTEPRDAAYTCRQLLSGADALTFVDPAVRTTVDELFTEAGLGHS